MADRDEQKGVGLRQLTLNFQDRGILVRENEFDVHPTEPLIAYLPDRFNSELRVWNYEDGQQVTTHVVRGGPRINRIVKFLANHADKCQFVVGVAGPRLSSDMSLYQIVREADLKMGKIVPFPCKIFPESDPRSLELRNCTTHSSAPCILCIVKCRNGINKICFTDFERDLRKQTDACGGDTITVLQFHTLDSHIFATVQASRVIKIWETEEMTVLQTFAAESQVTSLRFSAIPQKPLIIMGLESGKLQVWDYQRKKSVTSWDAHEEEVVHAFFHPHLPYILSASKDGTIKAWSNSNYQFVKTLGSGQAELSWSSLCRQDTMFALCTHDVFFSLSYKGTLHLVTLEVVCSTADFDKVESRSALEEGFEKEKQTHAQRVEELEIELRNVRMEKEALGVRVQELERKLEMEGSSREGLNRSDAMAQVVRKMGTSPFIEFSWDELKSVTNDFHKDYILEQRNYGCVYMGKITPVEVNRLKAGNDMACTQHAKVTSELVDLLKSLQHPHLQTLLGVCYEGNCLVYEHMTNGNVKDWIFSAQGSQKGFLPWYIRLRIMAQVAQALSFLHSNKSLGGDPIVHRAINPENIALGDNFSAKLTRIDAALLAPALPKEDGEAPSGMPQLSGSDTKYIAPEFLRTKVFTQQTDIYAFGITILEMLTGESSDALGIMEDAVDDATTFGSVLDPNAGSWDINLALETAHVGLNVRV